MRDEVPILDALTDEDRLEFISNIPRQMHARVDKLLVEAAEVEAFRELAERLGMPEKAPDTNIARKVVRTYLMTRTSVEGHQVEQFVKVYKGEILDDPMMEPMPGEAALAGEEVPTDEGDEGEAGGDGEGGAEGLMDV